MKEFSKSEIDILDKMVKIIIEKGFVSEDDLIKEKIIELKDTSTTKYNFQANDEFIRYLHLMNKYNICECFFNADAAFARKNEITFQFQMQGGFKTLYFDLKEKRKREKLELRKTEIDLNLSEKTLKEFPRTVFLARGGFVIGVLLLFKEIYDIFK